MANTILGTTSNDVLSGTSAEDEIIADRGNDKLFGLEGDDSLEGGLGSDQLTGGAGADAFVYGADGVNGWVDRILDFSIADGDTIDLTKAVEALGLDPATAASRVTFVQSKFWVDAFFDSGSGPVRFAEIVGESAADLQAAAPFVFSDGPPPPPAPSADDDGNLAVSAADPGLNASEAGAALFTVSGVDADATAVVTVTDSLGGTVTSAALASDGDVTLDLSGLADGALSVSVTATDGDGLTAVAAGPALTLDTDGTADADANLALTASDLEIDGTEAGAVSFTLAGLDAGATAVVTVTDGAGGVVTSGAITADGAVVLDLSGLADGLLTSAVSVTDAAGDTAAATGPGLSLDKSVNPPPPPADFNVITGTTSNDVLSGTALADEIIGDRGNDKLFGLDGDDRLEGGLGADQLTGGAGADAFVYGADGVNGWVDRILDFSIADGDTIDLTKAVEALGLDPATAASRVTFVQSKFWVDAFFDSGSGPVRFAEIVGESAADLQAAAPFVFSDGPPPPPAPSADDDGNLAVSAADPGLNASEAGAALFTVSGVDADATAVVTVTDSLGGTVTSAALASDGDVTLDLSGLADGALSVSVTATDGDGLTAVAAGPALTLDTDGTADADANLALTASDLEIDGTEAGAVSFTLAGLDAGATAVVTVTDGAGGVVTSGAITADGAVVLDLSGLADGSLTSAVSVTDAAGDTAAATGPGLSLDKSVNPPPPPADFNVITGTTSNDVLSGTALADEIIGDRGNDKLFGLDGDDRLEGGLGADQLTGGAGADAFVYGADGVNGWVDRILDFSIADGDTIDLTKAVEALGLDPATAASRVTFVQSKFWVDAFFDSGSGPVRFAEIVGESAADLQAAAPFVFSDGPPPPPAPSADDDGNLAVSAADPGLNASEAGAALFTVSGVDADATAVVTVTDSLGGTVTSAALASDGDVTLDLSGLADGALSVSVTATDGDGLTAVAAGPALTLDTDGTADADANLALTASDLEIDGTEAGAVSFTLAGLDAGATAVVTVTDGAGGVVTSGAITADGAVVLDLSGLADGLLTSAVSVTDAAGDTAAATGPGLSLDKSVNPPPPPADFNVITGTTSNDVLSGTALADEIIGDRGNDKLFGLDGDDRLEGGLGADQLTGGAGADAFVYGADGVNGWVDRILDFSIADGDTIDLTKAVEALGLDPATAASRVTFVQSKFWVDAFFDSGSGPVRFAEIVGESAADLQAAAPFVFSDGPPPPPAPSADDDGNLAVSAADPGLNASEAGAALFTVSGVDADATAVVTVTDSLGGTVTSAALASDGDVTLDLSGLADGALSVSVTATDGDGLTAVAAGPALTLDTDGTADADANLALTASDLEIDGTEAGAVSFTLAGLDAGATAVVTVTDGAGGVVTSGAITADGAVVLDLSGLADGPLTSAVSVTDAAGDTAAATGPGLSLDTAPPPASLDFSGETRGLSIDLTTGEFGYAARILTIGDSLTEGWVDLNTPTEDANSLDYNPTIREGYRFDLFENLIDQGAWIDYVGQRSSGPSDMLDTAHSGVGGIPLRSIVSSGGDADLSDNLATHAPDVVLLMAGTNDFNSNETFLFNTIIARVAADIALAVDQFYAVPGSEDKHLVISTLAPKLRGQVPEEFADFVNDGYSVVDGVNVKGDAGNGTYQPGLRQTVTDLQALHPTVHLYENPVDTGDLTTDQVHFSQAAFAKYAAGLTQLLVDEIGVSGGTLGGEGVALASGEFVIGGQGGDRIVGDADANILFGGEGSDLLIGGGGNDMLQGQNGVDRLEGGAGIDQLTGGDGGDIFVFGANFLDGATAGSRDHIKDFGFGGEDMIVFDGINARTVTVEDEGADVVLSVFDNAGVEIGEILVTGSAAQSLKGIDLGGGVFAFGGAIPNGVLGEIPYLNRTSSIIEGTILDETLNGDGSGTYILGYEGDDTITGGGSRDVLEGGAGADQLLGGSNSDHFRFASDALDGETDLILDFSLGQGDRIDISEIAMAFGWDAAQASAAVSIADNLDGDAVVTLTTPNGSFAIAELDGVDSASLAGQDFFLFS